MGDPQEAPTLFPTLLSPDELKSTLTEKFRSIPNLRRLTEAQLVSIYNSMILPLPQRLYSSNYRGRRLKDRRSKRGLEDKQATSKISTSGNTVSQSLPVRRTSGGDRLKPPPTASSTTTIKLLTQSSPSSTKASPLRGESSEAEPARKGSKRNDPPGDTPNGGENETPKKRKIEKITWP